MATRNASIAAPTIPTGAVQISAFSFAFNAAEFIGTNNYCVCYNSLESNNSSGLGVHISFVRSVRMDSWTEKQIHLMRLGGNDRRNDFLKSHGVECDSIQEIRLRIRTKYDSPAAELYKQVLKAELEGRPVPTELPKATRTENHRAPHRTMEGFGSTPPPPVNNQGVKILRRALIVAVPAVAVAALCWLIVLH